MTVDDKTRDKTLQHEIKEEAAKISPLSPRTIGKEMLPFNQSQITEEAKFTYSPLRKTLEKQAKKIKDTAEKQTKTIDSEFKKRILDTDHKRTPICFQKNFLSEEAIDKLNINKEFEQEINRKQFNF